jgi:hypothetical protein
MKRHERIKHLLSLTYGQFCAEAKCEMNYESFRVWLVAVALAKEQVQ